MENGWHLSITGDRQTDNMDSTKRASCWSVTINNPTPQDSEDIALARQAGWKVDGQLEVGEEDKTPHYQLIVKTPQVRFSAMKKAFPRAHIEVARSAPALSKYCDKAETRVAKLSASSEKYPSLSKYWGLVAKELDAHNPYILQAWQGVVEWDHGKAGYGLPTPLEALKLATGRLIMRGYHVESIASNPLTKSTWKDYHIELYVRAVQADLEETEMVEESAVGTAVDLPEVDTQHATQEEDDSSSPTSPCTHSQAGGSEVCPTCWERI